MSCRQLYSEPELYCVHRDHKIEDGGRNTIDKAKEHNDEQAEIGKMCTIVAQKYKAGNLLCLLSVHVDDIKGTSKKATAMSLLEHLNKTVGQCKADWLSFLHTGIQHEQSPGVVFTHQYVYIDSITPILPELLHGKDDEEECNQVVHDAYRSVLGAVAWTVLTRPDLAIYVQALQRQSHAPRIRHARKLNVLIRWMKKNPCGLKSLEIKHPLKLTAFTDAAFKAQPEESTGLALRGLVAVLQEDICTDKPHSMNGIANLIDFTVRRQRRVVRSTFSAELNGLVDSIEQMILLQTTLHQIYCGTNVAPEDMIRSMEGGVLYPPLDFAVDAKAVFDAIAATDACDPTECSLKLHLISVRDRMSSGMIRRLFWVDTRDMLADGLTKGGIDRELLHQVSNNCKYSAKHENAMHVKTGVVGVGAGGYGGGSATTVEGDPPNEADPDACVVATAGRPSSSW